MSIYIPTSEQGDRFELYETELYLIQGLYGDLDKPIIEYNEKEKRLSFSHNYVVSDTVFKSEESYLYINGEFIQDKEVHTRGIKK